MRARVLVPVSAAACAVGLSACGGLASEGDQARARTAAEKPQAPQSTPDEARDPRELPASVPLRAARAADPRSTSVIRAWTAALRAGDIDGANALWATPAKVQNGTPVLTLASRAEIGTFNGSLPCGSVVTAAGGAAGGFTIATVRLTARRGADCDAAGAIARAAILVREGRIVEWYRLPDDPDAPGLRPPPDDVESTTV